MCELYADTTVDIVWRVKLKKKMVKVKKMDEKVERNRNRVNFHRKWKSIFDRNFTGPQEQQIGQDNSRHHERQQNENMASKERLRQWALKYNISKRAVSDLLKILISFGFTWLPNDSRTLLSTPRYIEMDNLTNGKFWYSKYNTYKKIFNGQN